MQQHMVIKAMLGGLLGTRGQILLVYGVVPLMAGHALELAALRDLPCALGLLTHLVSGSVLLPLGYLAVPPHDVPGSIGNSNGLFHRPHRPPRRPPDAFPRVPALASVRSPCAAGPGDGSRRGWARLGGLLQSYESCCFKRLVQTL
jgi:hypothetical protein